MKKTRIMCLIITAKFTLRNECSQNNWSYCVIFLNECYKSIIYTLSWFVKEKFVIFCENYHQNIHVHKQIKWFQIDVKSKQNMNENRLQTWTNVVACDTAIMQNMHVPVLLIHGWTPGSIHIVWKRQITPVFMLVDLCNMFSSSE